jgi:hypothetical protein
VGGRSLHRDDDIGLAANQFRRQLWKASVPASRRSDVNLDIFALDITKITKCLTKWSQGFEVSDDKDADASHPVYLLRPRSQRPRRSRAAEKRDELAATDESCHLIRPAGRVTATRIALLGPPRALRPALTLDHRSQSSSASRRTASQAGFLLLIQSGERPSDTSTPCASRRCLRGPSCRRGRTRSDRGPR